VAGRGPRQKRLDPLRAGRGCLLTIAGSPTIQHTSQHVGPVGHDAVDAEAQQPSHGRFVVDSPDIDAKATVVRLAYESASDYGHDAFVFLGRLQRLERRVVKAAEMQHVKDPITQELDSGGGSSDLSLAGFAEARNRALIIGNNQGAFYRPSGFYLAEHGASMPERWPLISILNGAFGNASYKASSVGISTPLARHGKVSPPSELKR